MSRILITGAAGFIGSHLAEACVMAGHHVRVLVRYNSRGDRGWLDRLDVGRHVEAIAGDVRDADLVGRACEGVETVFHLAALIGIPYSYVSPLAYFRTNVEGTLNVLTAGRAADVAKVVLTSTSETYGSAQSVPMTEQHPVSAQSPYAASKIAADQLGLSFHRSFGLGVTIARPFNTYGPRQSERAIIPTLIAQLMRGEQVEIGNLYPVRDFTYVTDTVGAMLAIADSNELVGKAANIGTGEEVSVEALARLIGRLMGRSPRFDQVAARQRPASSEVDRLVCDSSRLRVATNWAPKYTLESGLRQTIESFRQSGSLNRPDTYAV